MLTQGKDLPTGARAICVSSVSGIVNNSPEYLVLNTKDKKGNAQLANIADGSVITASPLSVWDVWTDGKYPGTLVAPNRIDR